MEESSASRALTNPNPNPLARFALPAERKNHRLDSKRTISRDRETLHLSLGGLAMTTRPVAVRRQMSVSPVSRCPPRWCRVTKAPRRLRGVVPTFCSTHQQNRLALGGLVPHPLRKHEVGGRRPVIVSCSAKQNDDKDNEPVRDEDGTYIGTYSNFWSDFSQIRGLVLFSLFLGSFFIGGQVVAGLLVRYAALVCLASPLHQLD